MSAVLTAGGKPAGAAALADSSRRGDLADEFASNRSWEIDRALMLERSERRAWYVAIAGLMTMAAYTDEPETTRPTFRELRDLRDELGFPHLSMGMTGDFEVAIEEGATLVRIGSALWDGLS